MHSSAHSDTEEERDVESSGASNLGGALLLGTALNKDHSRKGNNDDNEDQDDKERASHNRNSNNLNASENNSELTSNDRFTDQNHFVLGICLPLLAGILTVVIIKWREREKTKIK